MPEYRFSFPVEIESADTVITVFAENSAGQGSDSVTVSPDAPPLIRDTFTDTNGTNLKDHAPDVDTVGGGWRDDGAGSITIQNGRAQAAATVAQHQYTIDAGVADYVVKASIRVPAASGGANPAPGIIVRYADDSNRTLARYNRATNQFEIFEWVSGSATLRDSEAASLASNADVDVEVTCQGSTITAVFAVGETEYTLFYGSLANTTATRVGIRETTQRQPSWDDFEVYAAPG